MCFLCSFPGQQVDSGGAADKEPVDKVSAADWAAIGKLVSKAIRCFQSYHYIHLGAGGGGGKVGSGDI